MNDFPRCGTEINLKCSTIKNLLGRSERIMSETIQQHFTCFILASLPSRSRPSALWLYSTVSFLTLIQPITVQAVSLATSCGVTQRLQSALRCEFCMVSPFLFGSPLSQRWHLGWKHIDSDFSTSGDSKALKTGSRSKNHNLFLTVIPPLHQNKAVAAHHWKSIKVCMFLKSTFNSRNPPSTVKYIICFSCRVTFQSIIVWKSELFMLIKVFMYLLFNSCFLCLLCSSVFASDEYIFTMWWYGFLDSCLENIRQQMFYCLSSADLLSWLNFAYG